MANTTSLKVLRTLNVVFALIGFFSNYCIFKSSDCGLRLAIVKAAQHWGLGFNYGKRHCRCSSLTYNDHNFLERLLFSALRK